MSPTVTTTTRFIVRCDHTLPADRLLRWVVREAEAAGSAWELYVAVPPPSLAGAVDSPVETLIVGHKRRSGTGFA
jgi:hypothetical protein